MKKILLSLALIVSSITVNYAQITEGHVTYKIDVSTENPDMEMVVGIMQGSTLDIYFKEKTIRIRVLDPIDNYETIPQPQRKPSR